MGTEAFWVPVAAAAIGGGSAAADRNQAKKGLKAQNEQNASNAAFLSKQSEKAAQQATGLFGSSATNRQAGMQRALEILGQTIPQQLSAFQEGNVGAQEQLLAGLPQIQNALLGLPVDMSGLQPRQIAVNGEFSQQRPPLFELPGQALMRADAPNQLRQQNQFISNLSGSSDLNGPTSFRRGGGVHNDNRRMDFTGVGNILGGFGKTFTPSGAT